MKILDGPELDEDQIPRYLVKWGTGETTWEPEIMIYDCKPFDDYKRLRSRRDKKTIPNFVQYRRIDSIKNLNEINENGEYTNSYHCTDEGVLHEVSFM